MRGFPPFQIFLLGLLFGLLAVPLGYLTGRGGHSAGAPVPKGEAEVIKGGAEHPEGEHRHEDVPVLIRVRFAHRPLSLSLKSEGKELLPPGSDLSSSPVEVQAEIAISHEGNELSLEAAWPEGTPDTALTVEVEPEGFETRQETRWSDGAALHEILTFVW
jgi:hypothetical protein